MPLRYETTNLLAVSSSKQVCQLSPHRFAPVCTCCVNCQDRVCSMRRLFQGGRLDHPEASLAPLAPYPRTSHAPTMPRASRRQCDGNQNTIDTSTSWCPPLSRASPHMLWSTLTGNGGIRRAPTRAGAATTCSFFPLTRRMKSTWLQEGTPREPNTPRQHAPLHAYGPVDHISQPQYSAAPTLRVHSIAGSSLVVRGTLSRGLYRAPDQGERRAGVRVKRRDYANRGYGTS